MFEVFWNIFIYSNFSPQLIILFGEKLNLGLCGFVRAEPYREILLYGMLGQIFEN